MPLRWETIVNRDLPLNGEIAHRQCQNGTQPLDNEYELSQCENYWRESDVVREKSGA